MGVVEALQNLESSRTIASLNGSHSDVRLGRLPTENGECSFHSQSPKLKRRIISAVRDFPPGCGRFAQINNLRPDKEATSVVESVPTESLIRGDKNGDGHGVDKMMLSNGHKDETDLNCKDIDTVETIESVTALEHEISDSPKNLHQLNNLRSVEEAASVGTAEALISRGKNGDGQGIEKLMVSTGQVDETVLMNGKAAGTLDTVESLTALQHEVSDLLKNPNQLGVASPNEDMVAVLPDINVCSPPVSNGNGVDKIAVKKYPPRRRVSAVRDFPLLCGRNVSLEERNFGKARSAVGDKPSSSNTPKTSVKQIGEDVQDDEFHKSDLEVNVSKVIGEVQPNCKGNAVQEMEKQDECKVNSKMNVVSKDTKKKCIEPSQESNGCQGVGDVGYSEEKVGKEMVVYHEKEIPSEKCLDECKVNSKMKVVPKDSRKECIEPSQENNGCQGPGDVGRSEELVGKEIVVYHAKESPSEKCLDISNFHNQLHEEDFESSELTSDRVMVMGLMAASNCPWRKGKEVCKRKTEGGMSRSKRKKPDFKCQLERSKTASRKKVDSDIGGKSKKTVHPIARKNAYQGSNQLVIWDTENSLESHQKEDLLKTPRSCCSDVCLPPFGLSSSTSKVHDNDRTVTRNKVRETLRLFQALCRKFLQEEEGKSKEGGSSRRRIDYAAAKILKDNGKYVNIGKQILGPVPGVEVGDEFHYRVELTIVGLHRQSQGGIDYVKHGGKVLATSIVASGGYADDLDNSDSLIYTGQGGNVMNTDKEPEDQKLERGNLALKNSLHENNPVRVIRGSESSDGKRCGSHGKLVFKFQLDRIRDQPELPLKEVKKSKKSRVRVGRCSDDISLGKESIPICAVNTIDDEKPPPFVYITNMIYPDWCRPIPPKGCSCTVACSDSDKCSCAVNNGGEIPYNFNGAIVEVKPLVYECGPSCKCPPSCYNRVSQRGIKFPLEIFKTESRGWGVRSLNSIPSGSFICEYIGELLEDKEAEERTGNDEYLFDIGNNYNDSSLWDGLSTLMPDAQSNSYEVVGMVDLPLMQHNMAMWEDLSTIVRDSDGNIKKKSCYCGSPECTGRLSRDFEHIRQQQKEKQLLLLVFNGVILFVYVSLEVGPSASLGIALVKDNFYKPDLKKAALARLSVGHRILKVSKSGVKKRNRQVKCKI
ncbi:SU(VAR)3-9 homolog 6 [Prunus dulcis]|uniref:SU(VAR)3-9 homolog 6 n=1 Tax=Prunus dulcis TaxID=3755 RepID=A0A4Y1RFK1_PRUDU|nr:SU(VAR)3-9 homolog 6 [Prunus dulcis]